MTKWKVQLTTEIIVEAEDRYDAISDAEAEICGKDAEVIDSYVEMIDEGVV